MGVDFINPIRKNEPQRIAMEATTDVIVSAAEDKMNTSGNTRTIFEAAKILRNAILKFQKWNFQGLFPQMTMLFQLNLIVFFDGA